MSGAAHRPAFINRRVCYEKEVIIRYVLAFGFLFADRCRSIFDIFVEIGSPRLRPGRWRANENRLNRRPPEPFIPFLRYYSFRPSATAKYI